MLPYWSPSIFRAGNFSRNYFEIIIIFRVFIFSFGKLSCKCRAYMMYTPSCGHTSKFRAWIFFLKCDFRMCFKLIHSVICITLSLWNKLKLSMLERCTVRRPWNVSGLYPWWPRDFSEVHVRENASLIANVTLPYEKSRDLYMTEMQRL